MSDRGRKTCTDHTKPLPHRAPQHGVLSLLSPRCYVHHPKEGSSAKRYGERYERGDPKIFVAFWRRDYANFGEFPF